MISNVCNILGNNIFVRTIYAGKINQHVSFKCNKPWMISVKLPLIVNSDVEIKEEKQIEEKKKINNSNKNDTCGSKVETKEQNINDVVSDKGVVDNKDKKFNDLKKSFNSRDNLVNKNKVDQEEMVRGNETISDNVVKKIEITSINNKDLNIELCGVKSKEENIDCKKGENNVVESIETILDVKFLVINFPIRKQIQLLSYSKVGVDSELPELSKADIVIAGGRSFGTEENFIFWLKPLALKLGAAIGATKGAVELGCAPDRFQIGSTGLIIAPKLYIAFGISGSDHHMVGIRDAKIIVAVNINKDAAIMSMADYFITMDMFDVISGMMKWLNNNKIMSIDHLIQNLDKNQSKPDQFKSDEQEVKSLQIS
ncbi:Electron transfer flavoprotein large subunit [Candidatus Hodgkinia cicadicola]|nr:Electron transfer flavoprotein large subunit [Candidatus Hodgkinia cicadicola]